MSKLRFTSLGILALIGVVSVEVWLTHPSVTNLAEPPVPAQITDKSFFLSAIRQASTTPVAGRITGITVPHHLLARDLIANTFAAIAGKKYDLIVVVSPDHFALGKTSVSVTARNLLTPFGRLKTEKKVVRALEKVNAVTAADFFYREHGIQAELPFVAYYFPNTPIVTITIKENATKEELDLVVMALKKLLPPQALIVQSTDFSHYLPAFQAEKKDRETIAVLQASDPSKIFTLHQPDNLDSIGAQYIQSRLQKEFFQSRLSILDHKNSQDYTREYVDQTTSYIIERYEK